MKEAQELNIFPEKMDVKTAQSYMHRMFNEQKVRQNYDVFMERTMAWLGKEFGDQFAGDTAKEADQYIRDIAQSIYEKITGLKPNADPFILIDRPKGKRGPFEERLFTIPDEDIEDFLENDIQIIGARYSRVMGADLEIARKFGHVDMRSWLGNDTQKGVIKEQYDELKARVRADDTLTKDQKDKLRLKYEDLEKRDRYNLGALRDRLRGTHKMQENNGYFAPLREAISAWNYMRAMGGVTVSSLGDPARLLMVHGPGRFISEGVLPLATNLKAMKLSAEYARQMGAAAELALNTRQATWADLTDPYNYGNPVVNWIKAATERFSKLTGMIHWNQFLKTWSATLSQNRILRNAEQIADKGWDSLSKKERLYMDFVNINPEVGAKLGNAFKQYGAKEGSIYLMEPQRMNEFLVSMGGVSSEEAKVIRSAYEAGVIKDVDGTIVTKGIGDTPLALDSPHLRLIFQFKSFALASHQRVLMRAASGSDGALAVTSGMASAVGIGALIYMLKQIEKGQDISDNPGKIVAEGVDRSGLIPVAMEFNNILEKWGGPGFFQAMTAGFPDADQSAPASRYAIRNSVGSLLGPTYGLATDVTGTIGNIAGLSNPFQDTFLEPTWTEGDKKALRRIAPGTTLPYWRWFIERNMME